MSISPAAVNNWRIIPRIAVALFLWMLVQVSFWFMALPAPNGAQSAFAATVWGAAAGFFGFYMNSGKVQGDGS